MRTGRSVLAACTGAMALGSGCVATAEGFLDRNSRPGRPPEPGDFALTLHAETADDAEYAELVNESEETIDSSGAHCDTTPARATSSRCGRTRTGSRPVRSFG